MGEGVRGWLAYVPPNGAAAFGLASLLGSFTIIVLGMVCALVWDAVPVELEATLLILIYGPFYTLFVIPFVAFGLAVFGVPAALLLRRYFRSAWVLPLALAWGALGAAICFQCNLYFFWGHFSPTSLSERLIHALFGLPPAFWAWLLYRRVLLARAAQEVVA